MVEYADVWIERTAANALHDTIMYPDPIAIATLDTYSLHVLPGKSEMIHETTYTGARKRLSTLMDQVTDTREPVLIRRRGKEPVALVAASELAGWMETAYLLRSPKNARRLREAATRAAGGRGEPAGLDELRARLGLDEG